MKVYLDASALNRPFDDHSVDRNRLESEAVLVTLQNVERGNLQLVSSSALLYETIRSPLIDRREYVASYLELATVFVALDETVRARARQLTRQRVAPADALHLACAEHGGADWFIPVTIRSAGVRAAVRSRWECGYLARSNSCLKGGCSPDQGAHAPLRPARTSA